MYAKLNPIYTALDNYQYSRAIKLASALPPTNLVARALLAHAYAKSQQRYNALLTLKALMGDFPELELELKYSLENHEKSETISAALAPKKGKKGKKKSSTTATTSTTVDTVVGDWSLIDQLDTPPMLPEDWKSRPTNTSLTTEATLLETLAMTLTTLRLPLTVYQMWTWASQQAPLGEYLVKTITSGLNVLVAPAYRDLSILPDLQVVAMQGARQVPMLILWAAQICMWQLEIGDKNDPKYGQRKAMLPRLAENLALKSLEITSIPPTEGFMLYLKALRVQEKFEDMLDAIDKRLVEARKDDGVPPQPPVSTLLQEKLQVLLELKRFGEAATLLEQELLPQDPDHWKYWTSYLLTCSETESAEATASLVSTCSSNEERKYPLRGPALIKVEIMSRKVGKDPCGDNLNSLLDSIQEYGSAFYRRAACTFDDLRPYISRLCQAANTEVVGKLLAWASSLAEVPSNEDVKKRQDELRGYIFALKVLYHVINRTEVDNGGNLPAWEDIVGAWKSFQMFDESDQVQKESRPADELLLLGMQRILYQNKTAESLLLATCLLYEGVQYSPYNAYLKIACIDIFSEIDTIRLGYQLYQDLYTKHIQHESCSYIILEPLIQGGCYEDAISVCQNIIRLQTTTNKEACQYIGEAMENGIVSQAGEFIAFHRDRMNRSLTTLEAKGVVLDCAPMYGHGEGQPLGVEHGILGRDADMSRAKKIVAEAYNRFGAFSLLRLFEEDQAIDDFSENRDFDIFSYEILSSNRAKKTKAVIYSEAKRRGLYQSVLVKAALCSDVCKSPKKGKVAKPGDDDIKVTKSLLAAIQNVRSFAEKDCSEALYKGFSSVIATLAEIVSIVAVGVMDEGVEDSFEAREDKACELMKNTTQTLMDIEKDMRTTIATFKGSCTLFSNCIIPTFALLRMCARVFDLFGWGKRKTSSKKCAEAIANFADTLHAILKDVPNSFPEPENIIGLSVNVAQSLKDFVDEGKVKETCLAISRSQREGVDRFSSALQEVLDELLTFKES